jgi:hypothetical protein
MMAHKKIHVHQVPHLCLFPSAQDYQAKQILRFQPIGAKSDSST